MVKRPRITDLAEVAKLQILCLLHYKFAHAKTPFMNTDSISDCIQFVGKNIIEFSISSLIKDGLLNSEKHNDGFFDYVEYKVSSLGIDLIDGWDDTFYDDASIGVKFAEVPGTNLKDKEEDTWNPLPLETSGPSYESAISNAEKAFDAIKGSNGYAETDSNERNMVVWSIGETLKQIKEGTPTKDQVVAGLVKPLKFISEKFATASMGEAAKIAVKAILSWLGLN